MRLLDRSLCVQMTYLFIYLQFAITSALNYVKFILISKDAVTSTLS